MHFEYKIYHSVITGIFFNILFNYFSKSVHICGFQSDWKCESPIEYRDNAGVLLCAARVSRIWQAEVG